MSSPDNPFAFPLAVPGDCMVQPQEGMTLRDWFAGHALSGMLSSESEESGYYHGAPHAAERAYNLADSMLAERVKK